MSQTFRDRVLQAVLLINGHQLLVASHEYSALTEAVAVRSMLTPGVDALVLVGADHLDETWGLLRGRSSSNHLVEG